MEADSFVVEGSAETEAGEFPVISGAVRVDALASSFGDVLLGDFRMRLRNAGNFGFGDAEGWLAALSG